MCYGDYEMKRWYLENKTVMGTQGSSFSSCNVQSCSGWVTHRDSPPSRNASTGCTWLCHRGLGQAEGQRDVHHLLAWSQPQPEHMSVSFCATEKKSDLESAGCSCPFSWTREHWQHLNMSLGTFARLKDPSCCEETRLTWCVCFRAGAAWLLSTSNLLSFSRSSVPKVGDVARGFGLSSATAVL